MSEGVSLHRTPGTVLQLEEGGSGDSSQSSVLQSAGSSMLIAIL